MLYIYWTICVLGITAIGPTIIAAFINPPLWIAVVVLIAVSAWAAYKADNEAKLCPI